jgi:hypothetical protein
VRLPTRTTRVVRHRGPGGTEARRSIAAAHRHRTRCPARPEHQAIRSMALLLVGRMTRSPARMRPDRPDKLPVLTTHRTDPILAPADPRGTLACQQFRSSCSVSRWVSAARSGGFISYDPCSQTLMRPLHHRDRALDIP